MSSKTKREQFPFNFKTVSAKANYPILGGYAAIELINPSNLYEVIGLEAYIRYQFDASTTTAQRKLLKVSVLDDINGLGTWNKTLTLSTPLAADANRRIDVGFNLTSIMNKTGRNIVRFDFGDDATYNATVELIKADMIYTAQGLHH